VSKQPLIVTSLVAQKRNNARCSVFINGEFAFGCTIDIAERFGLRKGAELTSALIKQMQTSDDMIRLKQSAYNYVSYKPRTMRQVRDAMLKKGFTADEAQFAIDFLMEFDLLDDKKYAQMYIADTMKRKAVGLDKLRTELRKRGVAEYDIQDVVAESFSYEELDQQTTHNALQAAQKKLRLLSRKEPAQRKPALTAYLQRQGFSWEIIKRTLAEVENELRSTHRNNKDDDNLLDDEL
jgi:regulatory protein